MNKTNPDRATRIGVLAIPGFALLSFASLIEPFRAANLLGRRQLYEVVRVGRARSSGGIMVDGNVAIGDAVDLDILFVVAGGDPMAFEDAELFAWLGRLARSGTILGGVSGGPVILAKAGLMAGRRMTVHWEHGPGLAEYDERLLIERTLYVIDRDRVTCAGGTAALDLNHALIARDHGAVFARLVSDWFMHTEIRPSGGPQRGGLVERVGTTAAPVLAAVETMEAHVADPLKLEALARIAGVSPRQLTRLFEDRLGMSAMAYYRALRLGVARRLIEGSPLSLTEIALATGFASSAHFSQAYRVNFGAPPSALRR